MLDPAFGPKPPRLQRTSSLDTREEITRHTWMSLMSLLEPREFFVTVDHSAIWRKHLSWAKTDGSQLRNYLTQRFGTNMVFMSLLLGAEVNVLFNSSHVTTQIRQDMQQMNHHTPHFWVGVIVTCSVVLTLATLLTTFTAWGMVSSISDANTHCVLRSSMGQYVCFLPSRLIVMALYSFLMWVMMFIFILMPHIWSLVLLALISVGFLHIVTVFSAFGRLIMHTGAMGSAPIFDTAFEEELLPRGLHTSLLFKAVDELRKGTSVTRQYKSPSRPIGRVRSVEGEDTSVDVRFNDAIWHKFPEENLRPSGRKHGESSVTDSATDILPRTALDRWVSQDSLIEVPADQTGGERPPPSSPPETLETPESQHRDSTAPPVQSLKGMRPPRIATKTARPGIEQQSVSDSNATSRGATATPSSKPVDAPRRSLTDAYPRPSFLNAGGHSQNSIRRMAASLKEDSDIEAPHSKAEDTCNSTVTFSPRNSAGRKPENDVNHQYDGSIDVHSTISTKRDSGKNVAEMEPKRVRIVSDDGTAERSERQRLLPPKPSLRSYSSDSMSRIPNADVGRTNDRVICSGAVSKPITSLPKAKAHARTETAELIDIVSRCVSPEISPEKGKRPPSFSRVRRGANDRK